MRVLLLDTNVVSILFKPDHSLHSKCFEIATGHEWFISFMTRGELLLWPIVNRWGPNRREELLKHMNLCTTLFADEQTCVALGRHRCRKPRSWTSEHGGGRMDCP